MRYLYTVLFYLSLPFIVLRLLYRSWQIPAYRQRIRERFGLAPVVTQANSIWLHAVSLGEAIAISPLISALITRFPDTAIVVSNMTPTGSNYIQKTFGKQVINSYVPYDVPFLIKQFLKRTRPRLVILMETELWPNLFHCCAQDKIPILIANARLSARSAVGYSKIKPLVKQMLQQLTLVAAQSNADAQRFINLGLATHKVQVLGNLKFDLELPIDLMQQAQQLRQQWGTERPIWVAASTHLGEEEIVLAAFTKIRQTLPNCLLILVPRHPERFKSVSDLCHQQHYRYALHSAAKPITIDTAIIIGDTLGELKLIYAASDLAFVGGSLVPVGGHNLLEPAALGVPAITGPYIHNFVEINRLLQPSGAVIPITNSDELAIQVTRLLLNTHQRQALGAKAKQLIAENKGTLNRLLLLIEKLWNQPN